MHNISGLNRVMRYENFDCNSKIRHLFKRSPGPARTHNFYGAHLEPLQLQLLDLG